MKAILTITLLLIANSFSEASTISKQSFNLIANTKVVVQPTNQWIIDSNGERYRYRDWLYNHERQVWVYAPNVHPDGRFQPLQQQSQRVIIAPSRSNVCTT